VNDKALLEYFTAHDLAYKLYSHEPIFTAKDGITLLENIRGAHCKNLFLKDKRQNYILVTILEYKKVDLKRLAEIINKKHISFGNSEELFKLIGVAPGSVTPYGLVHDRDQQVTFYLDIEILNYPVVNFHPLRNDQTIQLRKKDFLKFFELIKHEPKILNIPLL
jgi:Ala-tRNA(Pro) deacylase